MGTAVWEEFYVKSFLPGNQDMKVKGLSYFKVLNKENAKMEIFKPFYLNHFI